MGTGMMHLLICYIHLFYFSVYQAEVSHPHKLISDPRKYIVSVFSLLKLGIKPGGKFKSHVWWVLTHGL